MKPLGTVAPQLGKLIPRLGTNHDGEIVATVKAIERVLRGTGHDWHDLAGVLAPIELDETDWRALARYCADRTDKLTEREIDFIAVLAGYKNRPSENQLKWLRGIVDRLRGRGRPA